MSLFFGSEKSNPSSPARSRAKSRTLLRLPLEAVRVGGFEFSKRGVRRVRVFRCAGRKGGPPVRPGLGKSSKSCGQHQKNQLTQRLRVFGAPKNQIRQRVRVFGAPKNQMTQRVRVFGVVANTEKSNNAKGSSCRAPEESNNAKGSSFLT